MRRHLQNAIHSLTMTLSCLASYGFGLLLSHLLHQPYSLGLIGALWAVISTAIVYDQDIVNIISNIHIRTIGTFFGCAISWVIFGMIGCVWWTLCLAIFLTMMLCATFNIKPFRLACLCVALIYVVSIVDPSIHVGINVVLRFIESLIGSLIPLMIIWCVGRFKASR